MKELLEWLRRHSYTLTLLNYEGGDSALAATSRRLASAGVAVRTDETTSGDPANVAILHRNGEVQRAVGVEELPGDEDYGTLLDPDADTERSDLLDAVAGGTTISPETDRTGMLRISREFERRALACGEGTLYAGFQDLSVLRGSERTRRVYDHIADTDVSVTVFGYPDEPLGDVPYDVVEDEQGLFRDYWFLLYDGGGDPTRKAAMVSREAEPSRYDAFHTVDPDAVDALLERAKEAYPDYF